MPSSLISRIEMDRSTGSNGHPVTAGADDTSAMVRHFLADADEILTPIVTSRPLLAIGAALAAGVLLGWLIKRR